MKTKTIYAWFFIHGKQGERIEDSVEGCLNEVACVSEINHIKAMELHLSKDYVNPKITNFVVLRKEK